MDGEHSQRRSHVLVLHQNVGGHVQMGGGEIPDGLDAPGNQQIGNALGALGGDSDDAHKHLVGAAEFGQLRQIVNGLTLLGPLDLGSDVEGGQNVQAVLVEALIAHQGLPQLARADEHGVGGVVVAQKLLDVVDQGLPLVADLGPSAVRHHGQILANLHLAHIQGVGKRRGGNIGRRTLRHIFQVRQIAGQTLQHGLGYFLLFHSNLNFQSVQKYIDIIPYRLYHTESQKSSAACLAQEFFSQSLQNPLFKP